MLVDIPHQRSGGAPEASFLITHIHKDDPELFFIMLTTDCSPKWCDYFSAHCKTVEGKELAVHAGFGTWIHAKDLDKLATRVALVEAEELRKPRSAISYMVGMNSLEDSPMLPRSKWIDTTEPEELGETEWELLMGTLGLIDQKIHSAG